MYLGRYDSMQSCFSPARTLRKQRLGFQSLSVLQKCSNCIHSLHRWRLSICSRKFSRPKYYTQPVRGNFRVPILVTSSSDEKFQKETSCKNTDISELTRDQLPTEQLSWEDVERLTCNLVDKIKEENYIFDAILAVTRGGLVPATIAAESLELRTVFVATVIFYGDRGDPFYGLAEPRILFFPENASLKGRRVLVIDDVWDTGRTCKKVAERCLRSGAECKTAVLHYKPSRSQFSDSMPDFFSVTTDRWIVYPWELHSPVTRQLMPT
ncbi:hypothetical protein GpartN1_g3081.t1 [Galdieria partita]|uniref:Phosphoribosyltransferase domain-containing protein n=1 Tax=Galdieria partita TaxID=83374 RepID=A0A9C7UQ81_9RHOD|nr:hypothetical protein GpartN1_g3081.t1 [Galdieria partita]